MNSHLHVAITDEELSEWADKRADDAGRLARELIAYRKGEKVPQDVLSLVIAARVVAFEDQSQEAIRALDIASEAFADRVPWEGERACTPAPQPRAVACIACNDTPSGDNIPCAVCGKDGGGV